MTKIIKAIQNEEQHDNYKEGKRQAKIFDGYVASYRKKEDIVTSIAK